MDYRVIQISPEVMGGTPVFRGTRVPIRTLMDYLTAGDTIDEFLDDFPTVTCAQVLGFLQTAEGLHPGQICYNFPCTSKVKHHNVQTHSS